MSELGSILAHYTGQTDLKKIVSQSKLMLFYFMLCYFTSLQYREFLQ